MVDCLKKPYVQGFNLPWVPLFTIIPLSPECNCGDYFKKPYVQGYNLPWLLPFVITIIPLSPGCTCGGLFKKTFCSRF